jgi:hypothetical protein
VEPGGRPAVSEAISAGSFWTIPGLLASAESGSPTLGPIAAPAATPRASIPAASAAVTRSEGRRGTLGAGAVGVGMSDVVVMDLSRAQTGVPRAAFLIKYLISI